MFIVYTLSCDLGGSVYKLEVFQKPFLQGYTIPQPSTYCKHNFHRFEMHFTFMFICFAIVYICYKSYEYTSSICACMIISQTLPYYLTIQFSVLHILLSNLSYSSCPYTTKFPLKRNMYIYRERDRYRGFLVIRTYKNLFPMSLLTPMRLRKQRL